MALCYILICRFMHIYIYTCVIITMRQSFRKIYTSHFICNVCVWEGVGDRTELQHTDLTSPSGHSRVSFLFSRAAQLEARGPTLLAFSTASYHQLVWSPNYIGSPEGPFCWMVAFPTTLVSNSSDLQLADFLSPPSYIIVHSPTQSLEWHVWSSSSGNNCHAVQRSLSSGASVYECIMGFYLVPFHQPNPPTRFLSITGYWNVPLPSGASLWNGMFGRVKGQYTTLVGRVFASGQGDLGSIPSRVILKTLKMVLDISLLKTQHYKVCIKGKVVQSRERSSALPYTSV